MATITRREYGWQVQVRRRGYKSKSATFDTKAQAERWARKVEREMDEGKITGARNMTVLDLFEKFRDEITPTRKGEKWDTDRINKILRECRWVDLRCEELSPEILREHRDKRLQEVSGSSVVREFNLISGILSYARKEGWITIHENPCSLVKRPDENSPRSQRVTDQELFRIVGDWREVPKEWNTRGYLSCVSWFAVETALRQGELCDLLWIDSGESHVAIRDSKNGTGRTVPLSPAAKNILALVPKDSKYIFPLNKANVGQKWREATKTAGLSHIHFHDLRREATSRLAKKLDVMQLAKVTGHKDIKILLSTYYSPTPEELASKLTSP